MVAPIVKRDYDYYAPGVVSIRQRGWSQTKPYDRPLEYYFLKGVVAQMRGVHSTAALVPYATDWVWSVIPYQSVINKAYAKFRDAVHEDNRSELLTFALELDQASDMVRDRALWGVELIDAIRRRKYRTAAAILVRSPNGDRRAKGFTAAAKTASGTWLEFNYGWIPTAKDLHSAFTACCQQGPRGRIRKAASTTFMDKDVKTEIKGGTGANAYYEKVWDQRNGTVRCAYMANVQVTNPNTALLAQLGLLNPVLSVLQVLPSAHVVNWFIDFENVVGSYTDFIGYSLTDPQWVTYTDSSRSKGRFFQYGGITYDDWGGLFLGVEVNRRIGILLPKLITQWGIKSWPRAANAVSELMTRLPRR